MLYIGMDPGYSGATAFLCEGELWWVRHDETPHDIMEAMISATARSTGGTFSLIEKVASRPGQGVASSFKFGTQYGIMLGLLTALRIPYETTSPQKWQKALGCLSKGDKRVTKAKAQELFPEVKMTHAIADAILIAEYCRRVKG